MPKSPYPALGLADAGADEIAVEGRRHHVAEALGEAAVAPHARPPAHVGRIVRLAHQRRTVEGEQGRRSAQLAYAVEGLGQLERRPAEAVPALRRRGVERLHQVRRVDGRLLLDLEELADVPVAGMMREPALGRRHLAHSLRRVQRAEGLLGEGAIQIGPGSPVTAVGSDHHPRRGPAIAPGRHPAPGEGEAQRALAVAVAADEQVLAVAVVVEAAHVHALPRVVEVEPLHVHEVGVGVLELLTGLEPEHAEACAESVRPGEPVVLGRAELDAAEHDPDRVDQRGAGGVGHAQSKARSGIARPEGNLALDAEALGPRPSYARDATRDLGAQVAWPARKGRLAALLPRLPRGETCAILLHDFEPSPAQGRGPRRQRRNLSGGRIQRHAAHAVVEHQAVAGSLGSDLRRPGAGGREAQRRERQTPAQPRNDQWRSHGASPCGPG